MIKYGIVSLYANPLHVGHLDYIEAANQRCNVLVAIVNNDTQVKLKGSKEFMDEDQRVRIVQSLKFLDGAMLSIDDDDSVCETIKDCYNHIKTIHRTLKTGQDFEVIFFNSGDRQPGNENKKEVELCDLLGIRQVFLPLPKVCSSTVLKERLGCDRDTSCKAKHQ